MITIGYSTRTTNPKFQEYLKQSCGLKNVEVIEKVNNGEKSLSQVYNEIIDASSNDILVLCHDDIYFDTKNWGRRLDSLFQRNLDYGIIGLAGTKYLPKSAKWWEVPETMYGIVNHKHEGKKWASNYSKPIDNLEDVVLVDGLFIAINKKKITNKFDELINGFHFYDVSFCVNNFLNKVKIGVTTSLRVTHLSIGMTNQSWEDNREYFSKKYDQSLPLDITNENLCETFIFCHDQKIIKEYEVSGKFKNLKKYNYVFLGNGNVDEIKYLHNLIIARNCDYNMEDSPNMNAYTGWYCLWKNGFIKTPYVNLFEYDVILNPFIEQKIDKLMREGHNFIGYVPVSCSNFHFIDNKLWVDELFESIKKVCNVNLERTIRVFLRQNPSLHWSSTSNCTLKSTFFHEYMKWFEPIAENIKFSKTAGHAHERSTTFFCFMFKIQQILTQNLLKHFQMNSHKTQDHVVDFDKNLKQLVENI
jgi:hypothetical protein